jgi:O-antigen ligase
VRRALASTLPFPAARAAREATPAAPGLPARAPLIETAFLILIVLAPLPFGSNRPVWWSGIALCTALLVAAYAYGLLKGKAAPGFRLWQVGAILLPALAALTWGALQAAPPALIGSGLVNPLWTLAGTALGTPLSGAISLDPHESLTGVLRLSSYLMIFWLALELGRQRPFADRLLRWVAYGGMAYAGYGLALHMLGIERILWVPKTAYLGYLTSTFVNRNSYATYAVLGLLASTVLFIQALRSQSTRRRSLRRQIVAFIEKLTGRAALPLLACATLTLALLLTGSRMGALCGAAGLAVLLCAAALARVIPRRQTLILLGLLGAGFLAILAFNGGVFVDRLATKTLSTDSDARADLYALTARAIGDNPLVGTGLGTFPEVFALYRDDRFDTLGPIGKAHNSYLGNALELGVPAAMLLLAGLAALAETVGVGLFRRKRGKLFPVLGAAALTAVALHSLVDFSLEIPAVSLTFAALMGVCCAQSYRTRKRKIAKQKPALRLVPAE